MTESAKVLMPALVDGAVGVRGHRVEALAVVQPPTAIRGFTCGVLPLVDGELG
ncbi:hypothetical protein [Streptomyces clavuligerus]|uniref:hypothetical protein n=1 Tax=Streptomyces clavuligerus TaxID=1901 RepID=UPI001F0740CA|nr:hypothetical protein [Streptomyces clavuligerus]